MILRDADMILAAGSEIRMTSLGDPKLAQSIKKSYKVLLSCVVNRRNKHISFKAGSSYTKHPV